VTTTSLLRFAQLTRVTVQDGLAQAEPITQQIYARSGHIRSRTLDWIRVFLR
jgi:hypothetical protein